MNVEINCLFLKINIKISSKIKKQKKNSSNKSMNKYLPVLLAFLTTVGNCYQWTHIGPTDKKPVSHCWHPPMQPVSAFAYIFMTIHSSPTIDPADQTFVCVNLRNLLSSVTLHALMLPYLFPSKIQ